MRGLRCGCCSAMTMYSIKRGESLPLCYSIAGKINLVDWEARVFILRELTGNPEAELGLSLASNQNEFSGLFESNDTRNLNPRMYWLVCDLKNTSTGESVQIKDKLLVDEGYYYNPA